MLQNDFVADENVGNVQFVAEFIYDTCHSPSWVLHITKYREARIVCSKAVYF